MSSSSQGLLSITEGCQTPFSFSIIAVCPSSQLKTNCHQIKSSTVVSPRMDVSASGRGLAVNSKNDKSTPGFSARIRALASSIISSVKKVYPSTYTTQLLKAKTHKNSKKMIFFKTN